MKLFDFSYGIDRIILFTINKLNLTFKLLYLKVLQAFN